MKRRILWTVAVVGIAAAAFVFWPQHLKVAVEENYEASEEEEHESREAMYVKDRAQYEFNLLKDPVTGALPKNIFQRERDFALTIPVRSASNATARIAALNNYIPAGPNNIGGRTRTVAYDQRYNSGSNRVILAGCVSGGILRSADGGNSWTRVTPENEIHNLTSLAQDPRSPDVWYAGGGEFTGNTADEIGALYLGYGIYKSINNGLTWTRQTLSILNLAGTTEAFGAATTLQAFDHPFDYVHKIAIDPTNSNVYIAGHRRLVRSTNGGSTFQVVFEGSVAANSITGQMDVTVSNTGKVYLAINGGNPDPSIRGVWTSATGGPNTFSRIAGGQTIGTDSVEGWQANVYPTTLTTESRRILVALAPSNNNIGYVYYENGMDAASPSLKPEVDLFRFDLSGSTYTWSNRSANMPDFPGGNLAGSDPITVQNGYDMEVKVKPDNADVVFISGTNLYRSTDGFSSTANTAWIGGYSTNFTYGQYAQSHSDVHYLAFKPNNPNSAICANDGGIQESSDITAPTVAWTMLPNYQTLQIYNVAIDPTPGRNNFASGSQDNGVRYRDGAGLRRALSDSNNHELFFSADGAFVGISAETNGVQYLYESIQYGRLYRARLIGGSSSSTEITPAGLTSSSTTASPNQFGEFVTNLRLENDNSEDLYYVNFNRLFRTTAASTATSSSWTELTGVSSTIDATNGRSVGIRGLAFSRGPYVPSKSLYLGTTNGKIFRVDDPRNVDPMKAPANITPTGLVGNVQDIAVNPNNDNEILAVVSNYTASNVNVENIWYTNNAKDAAPNWRKAEGNLAAGLISARSCAIVVKKDAAGTPVTEYYVGTGGGLYSTTNLGTVLGSNGTPTWQREGGNVLNLAVITSLAYRPVDNVLLVGTHGNGMYYTFLGTPNFNIVTGINVITNDRNFIKIVFPTVVRNNINFQTGNMLGIKKLQLQVTNLVGQTVVQRSVNYQSGTLDLGPLPAGSYVLQISSPDGRYRHVQKFVRQ